MEGSLTQRSRYHPSGRVDWGSFLPWALVTSLIALAMGGGMNWLFQRGWYLLFVMPIFAAMFAALLVLISVSKGKCRSPLVGSVFGLCIGVLLYGGYLYFGMLSLVGIDSFARFDLFPKYLSLRLHTDTSRNIERPDETAAPPDPVLNGIKFSLEAGMVLLFTTAAGYRRSQRSFCEQCGAWKKQDLAVFPPGNGKTIAGWLEQGELAKLAAVSAYTTRGRNKRATLVALERCEDSRGDPCPVYVAVKDVSYAGASGRFDSAFGKMCVSRVELFPDELSELAPHFPATMKVGTAVAGSDPSPAALPAIGRSAFIEVKPIPPSEAHKVLSRGSILRATGVGLIILPVFYASIAGVFAGIYYSMGGQWRDHLPAPSIRVIEGLVLAAVSLTIAVFSGMTGLRNASAVGNLYFRRLSRRSIAPRKDKWVDPDRPGDLPTYFTQVVPRKNWGTMMLETASDTGFLQIDHRRKEIRFEGDIERFRIPAAAITDCSIATYSTSASSNLKYYVLVIQGRTAAGPWEAPISLRPTDWLPPKNHRRLSAEMLRDQIMPLLAASPALAPDREAASGVQRFSGTEPQELKPRVGIFSKIGMRLMISALAIAFFAWRGNVLRHEHERLSRIIGMNQDPEPGDKMARLQLAVTNVRYNQQITDDAPYYRDGGDWTVFDCSANEDSGATFTVAIEKPKYLPPPMKMGFSQAAILPRDRESGARFISALAAALNVGAPATRPSQPLKVQKFSTVVMGENFGSPEQGLREGTGTWVATSWSYENEGLEGEVYFNYDLRGARAEFAGTTAESDSDELEAIATAVRDGPRPPRSQVNDPNFTSDGPKVVDLRPIPDSLMTTAGFAPGAKLLILWNRKAPAAVSAITLDDSRDRTTLAHFDGAVNFVICADANANGFVVDENAGADSLAFGANATHRIWWINRTTGARNQITGPWGSRGYAIGKDRLSPDGRYLAISCLSGTVLDQNRKSNLFLVDMQDGKSVQANGDNLFPIVWRGTGGDLRALVRHFLRNGSKTLAVDPQTGNVTPISSESDSDRAVSPDGQWKFVVQPNVSVKFEPTAGGQIRTFTFSEVDRRFALPENISWLSPRYLRFSMAREGFIDLATMKMGYLPTVDSAGDGPGFQFSNDFRWALFYGKDGVSLGRVVVPGVRPVATDH